MASITTVDAKAERTKNVVETGIPILVNKSKMSGAAQ
jgi:hypothetical protein